MIRQMLNWKTDVVLAYNVIGLGAVERQPVRWKSYKRQGSFITLS